MIRPPGAGDHWRSVSTRAPEPLARRVPVSSTSTDLVLSARPTSGTTIGETVQRSRVVAWRPCSAMWHASRRRVDERWPPAGVRAPGSGAPMAPGHPSAYRTVGDTHPVVSSGPQKSLAASTPSARHATATEISGASVYKVSVGGAMSARRDIGISLTALVRVSPTVFFDTAAAAAAAEVSSKSAAEQTMIHCATSLR